MRSSHRRRRGQAIRRTEIAGCADRDYGGLKGPPLFFEVVGFGRGPQASPACATKLSGNCVGSRVGDRGQDFRFAKADLLVAGDEELFVGFAAGDAAFAGDLF